jgi:predicted enzyme related to lactoylglutathione lyase
MRAGERTSYAPGTFSWVDLATTDVDSAKRFYGALFGWEAEDMPAGDAGVYTMFRLEGNFVAACYEQGADQREQGVPPNWLSYVTVDDVEARTVRARELGAAVLMDPLDVMDAGRLSVVQDPEGAVFAMWQPGRHVGAQVVNEPGALCWNELMTRDVERAKRFYGALFGWAWDDQTVPAPYTTIVNGGRRNGGMVAITEDMGQVPPDWNVYFAVADCEAAVARAEKLGGTAVVPTTEIVGGRFAIVSDPQSAGFCLFAGQLDP